MDDLGSAHGYTFATVNDSGGIDYAEMNKGVTPFFHIENVPDEKATEAAGALRMREQEIVHIRVSGDQFNIASHPVTEEIKNRFAPQYEAFKAKRKDMHIEGTPLENWPMLPALRVAEFKALNIFSVEQLSGVADTNISKLMDGRIWREKAVAWLASAKDHGAAAKYAAENARLNEQIEAMQKQIADLVADKKRGPGRPRKEAA